MFSYLINRWAFGRRFEKFGDDYIYRRRADLPGIVMSEEERGECLRAYRRRYWRWWAISLGIMLAGVCLVVFVAMVFEPMRSEGFIRAATYLMVAIFLTVTVWEQRQWARIPERGFPDRPRIPSSILTGNWFARYQALAQRRSWINHGVLLVIYGSCTWFSMPHVFAASLTHWFVFALFASCFAVLVFGAVSKARASV